MPGQGWEGVLPPDVLTRLKRQHPNILLIGPAAFALAAMKSNRTRRSATDRVVEAA